MSSSPTPPSTRMALFTTPRPRLIVGCPAAVAVNGFTDRSRMERADGADRSSISISRAWNTSTRSLKTRRRRATSASSRRLALRPCRRASTRLAAAITGDRRANTKASGECRTNQTMTATPSGASDPISGNGDLGAGSARRGTTMTSSTSRPSPVAFESGRGVAVVSDRNGGRRCITPVDPGRIQLQAPRCLTVDSSAEAAPVERECCSIRERRSTARRCGCVYPWRRRSVHPARHPRISRPIPRSTCRCRSAGR
jgi:hypothetical protein